jgi:pimeloyl-ACP methyl ester carboxylesterase
VTVEEVQFRHGDDHLAGSLYRPQRPGRHPAVALVLGSGEQNRVYGGVGPALGQHLAQSGFVCLAWDKPGIGKSTGDFNTQTFQDRAEEALAAVRFLCKRPEVRTDAVGLWGHSQGGMVAPLAAALSRDVAFVLEVSGWQGPAWQQDAVRVENELRTNGFPEADIKKAVGFARLRMNLIRGTGPFEDLDSAQAKVKTKAWFAPIRSCDRTLFYAARRVVNYDSETSWEKVHCPVLVLYGDKDTSSGSPEPLIGIIRRGLLKAKNEDLTVCIFPNADHSLCSVKKEVAREQASRVDMRKKQGGPDFVPGYLETMVSWLNKRFPEKNSAASSRKCRAALSTK